MKKLTYEDIRDQLDEAELADISMEYWMQQETIGPITDWEGLLKFQQGYMYYRHRIQNE